ncbi:MAG: hypothetical protein H7062_20245 [Candidatus Saccharimonas sp.]|nr:hypothetical protein [Planctomycetaceae bacterium]
MPFPDCCRCLVFAVLIQLWFGSASFAGLAPENVAVVVNADSPASVAVADEYVKLRGIPAANVIALSKLSHIEQMPVDKFREEILGPVLKTIEGRGLSPQIDCIAYSADLPTAIHVESDIGQQKLPRTLTPVASINGLTFLHRLTMVRDIHYLDLNANLYARRVVANSADSQWKPDELQTYAEAIRRLDEESARRRPRQEEQPVDALWPANDKALFAAVDALIELKRAHPQSSDLLYNLACALASIDRPTEAVATLKDAVRAGWWDHRHAARDPDLRSLRDLPEFKPLLDEMKSLTFEMQPACGFRAEAGWLPNGEPTEPQGGARYLLSTVLAVTAGRGNSVEDALASLRRSAAADGTKPTGTVYFLRNGDIRSTTREWAFEAAAKRLKALGVNAVIEDGVLPQQKTDVAGAVIGIADFDWPKSGSSMLPGAIVEHLTSFGGVMTTGSGQTPLTEFLRHGAAGSSGTVTEPFALQAKFPNAFLHVHYASGCSLAEAFYQSVTGPYQLLIVGDPLCAPWRKQLTVTVDGLAADKPFHGKIALSPKADSPDGLRANEFSLYIDGLRVETIKPGSEFILDTTRLADGSHTITILACGNDLIETIGRWTAFVTIRNGAK